MRITPIVPGEHYHIFNRGNRKQKIFLHERDWIRFLFTILYLQSPSINFPNIGRSVSHYVENSVFNIKEGVVKDIVQTRYVELVGFTLMPNHFHLIVYEKEEGGISQYMQRALLSYTKYFNTKHDMVGHVFQGPYKAVHVKNDNQLSYLSAYVHRNPRELKKWKNKEHRYPWSSYQDFIGENRWGKLLVPDMILERFADGKEYKGFVEESGAKETDKENYSL